MAENCSYVKLKRKNNITLQTVFFIITIDFYPECINVLMRIIQELFTSLIKHRKMITASFVFCCSR